MSPLEREIMKIQERQSLYSSIAFGVVFIIMSVLIYMLYYENIKKETYKNLRKTAHIVALFHLEEDELNVREFEKVQKQFEEIVSGVSYQVYDKSGKLVYGHKRKIIIPDILKKIEKEKRLDFSTDTEYCHGIFYEDNQGDFVIITKEAKSLLNKQLFILLWILISALIIGLITVILLSKWLARIAYKPFSNVIEQVKGISPDKSGMQIESPHTDDELQELTDTFNHLLRQISETFVIQKNFVNYVSHEFKTPLAAMLGNLEVFSMKERSANEYSALAKTLIAQIHQLEEILNTLIIISDLRKNTDISSTIRIDDLIWKIIERISHSHAGSKINIRVEILPEDENLLAVKEDRTQLLMALFNIIENAVKYSQGEAVDINLYNNRGCLNISIQDRGIGIPEDELENISKPFYRANNTSRVQGSGIGLSIALRILEKNDIKYNIQSESQKGTRITISFGL